MKRSCEINWHWLVSYCKTLPCIAISILIWLILHMVKCKIQQQHSSISSNSQWPLSVQFFASEKAQYISVFDKVRENMMCNFVTSLVHNTRACSSSMHCLSQAKRDRVWASCVHFAWCQLVNKKGEGCYPWEKHWYNHCIFTIKYMDQG